MPHYVTAHRTYDPIEGRFLVDFLRHNGILARFLGSRNAAGVGLAQFMVQLRVDVPQEDLEQARELLDAFFTEYDQTLEGTPTELQTAPSQLVKQPATEG